MNYLQLCKLTRQECGIQGEGPVTVVSQRGLLKRIVEWVRDADSLIQSIYSDWDFMWSEFTGNTILGSDTILKPDDLGMWDRESFAVDRGTVDGRALNLIDFKEWRNNNSLNDDGPPSSIAISPNGNLRLSQPADGEYEIYASYWRNVTAMSANDDTPPYPDRFHRIIVARAKMFFYEDQEAWDNYKLAQIEYVEWLAKLEGYALPGQQPASQSQPDAIIVRAL